MKKKKGTMKLPKPETIPDINLDAELFRQNVMVAQFIILSGLIHGDLAQREKIFASVRREYFSPELFEGFLFDAIEKLLRDHLDCEISPDFLVDQIRNFYSTEWEFPPEKDKEFVRGLLSRCAQIIKARPSVEQLDRAIELRKHWARKEGVLQEKKIQIDRKILTLPKPDLIPKLDLNDQLLKSNEPIAEKIILSGLIHGNRAQREKILTSVRREYFSLESFAGFLFEAIADHLKDNLHSEISGNFLVQQIPGYYATGKYGEYVYGVLFTCTHLLSLHPSEQQIDKAIEVRRLWADGKDIVKN